MPSTPDPVSARILLHASCVAIRGMGVLLRGSTGTGKSDLALRLMDRGAILVSDDICEIRRENGQIFASPPSHIAGQMEVRGIGIIAMDFAPQAPLSLIIDLVQQYPRMPHHADGFDMISDIECARIAINPFEASAPHKVELALSRAIGK